MPFARLNDNGSQVEIDLHGVSLLEAQSILDRLIPLARRRGRSSVKVIHGSSTYHAGPSIKAIVQDALQAQRWTEVSHALPLENETILSLTLSGGSDSARLTILDIA